MGSFLSRVGCCICICKCFLTNNEISNCKTPPIADQEHVDVDDQESDHDRGHLQTLDDMGQPLDEPRKSGWCCCSCMEYAEEVAGDIVPSLLSSL